VLSSPTLWLKLLAALLALAAAAIVVLDQTGVWPVRPAVRAGAGLAAAALAFLGSTASAIGEHREQKRIASTEHLRYALRTLAFAVAETTRIDVRELGLAVYVVRVDWPTPWRRRLDRVVRERSVHRPTAARVEWRPGKGVIGRCVATGTDVAQDVAADMAPWEDATREDWDLRIPAEVKAGFTFEEFQQMHGRYHVVVATPILDDTGRATSVVGCLALDGPAGSYDELAADDVRAAMAALAPTIGALLR
jgi:hypothetical protein